jgi:hypothetical protein
VPDIILVVHYRFRLTFVLDVVGYVVVIVDIRHFLFRSIFMNGVAGVGSVGYILF